MPFTLRNIKEDLEDLGSRFDGAPDLEFRSATRALELEQSALSYQRVPPGYRFPYGHTHKKQEEVYVVVRGSGRMKVDDEIVELEEWDAVRVPPGMWRGYEAGPEGLEILVIGAPNLGDAPREDVEGQRDWWADQSVESQDRLLDLLTATGCEAAVDADASEPSFLQYSKRTDVVRGRSSVHRTFCSLGKKNLKCCARDAFPPLRSVYPVGHLELIVDSEDLIVPATAPSTSMTRCETLVSARRRDVRLRNAWRSV